MYLNKYKLLIRGILLFVSLCAATTLPSQAESVSDRIAAVVDDGVILESELNERMESIKKNLKQSNTNLPPDSVLARQVLERLIVDKLQAQMAERAGLKVDDETMRTAVQQIAQRNNMSPDDFRRSLRDEGMDYNQFIDQLRNEILVTRLRSSQINNQIKVSDREVQHYLETQGKAGASRDNEYLLGHILIATPRAASPSQVQKAKEKADRLMAELKKGQDFKQTAVSSSDGAQALSGGELGWRKKAQIPDLFVDLVDTLKEGELAGPIRDPSGFHIVKMLGVHGANASHLITKTRVRHILIKPNEVISDEEARQKLLAIKNRIEGGEDFGTLARGNSDDKNSAIKGGELGWVQPGALVPPFEEAMKGLAVNQLSDPVQTQFGWHLLQVLERQDSDDSDEYQKNRARDDIFKRKVEEETELWLRRLRDEAYVEVRLGGA